MPLAPTPPSRILIVGGGEFGTATALSLIKGPYAQQGHLITILERSATPPATDAASSDLNKIIRQEYSDEIYARLAHQAMELWRTDEWKRNYYETGVVVAVGKTAVQSTYISSALAVNSLAGMETPGLNAYVLESEQDVKSVYPSQVPLGDFARQNVYINEAGGWGHARGAVVDTVVRLRKAGVRFVAGEASKLIYGTKDGKEDVVGVQTRTGENVFGELVALCMGSWTAALLPELGSELLSTGQVLGTIQLTKEEYERYKDVPVTRMVDNGFYIFPPTVDGVVKFAIHSKGYVNPVGDFPSLPRTTSTPGFEDQQIPPEARYALKKGLQRVYPELALKKWSGSRICWYSDRPSGDWLFDYHPVHKSLFIAAGCCGHAFKFMPIIGDLILSSISGTLPADQKAIWSYHHTIVGREDASRSFSELKLLPSGLTAKL